MTHAESSKPSVNERLARAREQDLRTCRNLQAKLARAQLHDAVNPAPSQRLISTHAPSSSRTTGLLFLSSTQQAQREREQRSRERQLKRQVAGPIPPHSWRDEFERLSVRRGVASLDRQRLLDLVSSTGRDAEGGKANGGDVLERERVRRQRAAVCAGLRYHHDGTGGGEALSLRDMTLCVIADALNRPSVANALVPEMDRAQIREVLEYLPRHMQHRMLALCGRLAATDWPLSEWAAQALVHLDKPNHLDSDRSQHSTADEADDDWEASIDTDPHPTPFPRTATATLDVSFSTLTPRTLTRLLSTLAPLALTTLSLAGISSAPLDTRAMHAVFAQLPNLQLLCLAGSSLSTSSVDEAQRAGVFLRKLSRSCAKLETLDVGACAWVSAEAVLAVSWGVAWPRMRRVLLSGCAAVVDPGGTEGVVGKAAGNWVAPWHAVHVQRFDQPAEVVYTEGRDAFDVFSDAAPQRSAARARFSDYVSNAIQPAIVTHMTPAAACAQGADGVLMEYVRCPRSAAKVEMWLWTRARILDAIRGRAQPGARQRAWIDVYF
ncbi:uncharacterized protein SRS1_14576 [Sporisorium reilianum f. sp. reilianum]|uniref:Uncharacterized protein n=1 Tax=Sporisorium reilianum f. sp. reilianum TaxID=72559 RepID=A0A2N8UFX3_9BASI|nr:uncharacterized protein SRS1_14576 [Sporisorium reilianum f. sp. reilianum]